MSLDNFQEAMDRLTEKVEMQDTTLKVLSEAADRIEDKLNIVDIPYGQHPPQRFRDISNGE
jgi:hypothetical protein